MGKKWNNEEKEFFNQNYKKMSTKEIAQKLNRSETSVYSFAKNNNIKKGKIIKAPKTIEATKIIETKKTVDELLLELDNALKEEEKQILKRLSNLQTYKELIIK